MHAFDLPRRIETIEALPMAPWERGTMPRILISPATKEEAVAEHHKLLATLPDTAWVSCSDGSLSNGLTGSSATQRRVEADGTVSFRVYKRDLGTLHSIYDGELDGIGIGLQLACLQAPANVTAIYHFADSQAALRTACEPRAGAGQGLQLLARDAFVELERRGLPVTLAWCPGHKDVAGNEVCDAAAKAAAVIRDLPDDEAPESMAPLCRADLANHSFSGPQTAADVALWLPSGSQCPTSLSAVRQQQKDLIQREWATDFRRGKTAGALKRVEPHPPGAHRARIHKQLKKPQSALLTQLRTGHCALNAHLFRTGCAASSACACGASETLRHYLLLCPRYAPQRARLRQAVGNSTAGNVRALLSSPKASVTSVLLSYVAATRRFATYTTALEAVAAADAPAS